MVRKSTPARALISPVYDMQSSESVIKKPPKHRQRGSNATRTHVPEASTHDDGLVTVLLVVVEDLLDADNTGVFVAFEVLSGSLLVPVQDAADEGGDKGDVRLGASDGLGKAEEEGEVAVDAVVTFEFASSLDTLPCGRDLDQDAVLLDADGLVESDKLLGLYNNNTRSDKVEK